MNNSSNLFLKQILTTKKIEIMLTVSNKKNVKRVNTILSIVAIVAVIALFICGLIAGGADMSN